MGILLKVLKKALYSPKTKHNTIIIAILALIVSPITAATSVALADSNVQTGNAFLSVVPLDNISDDNNDLILSNGAFMESSKMAFAPSFASSHLRNSSELRTTEGKPSATVKSSSGKFVTVTAYSSTVDQTDDSPFITANGTYVRDGIIAANFLPFGTKVKFPEYSGDKIFTVQDRMAKKHNTKMDIWMESRGAAMQFGVKRLAYEIVE